jgi:hypothetical protein
MLITLDVNENVKFSSTIKTTTKPNQPRGIQVSKMELRIHFFILTNGRAYLSLIRHLRTRNISSSRYKFVLKYELGNPAERITYIKSKYGLWMNVVGRASLFLRGPISKCRVDSSPVGGDHSVDRVMEQARNLAFLSLWRKLLSFLFLHYNPTKLNEEEGPPPPRASLIWPGPNYTSPDSSRIFSPQSGLNLKWIKYLRDIQQGDRKCL